MQGVTSTGNTENRGTSGEGSSTGTTQGQMQGGRSVQQQTSVQPTLQSFCSAMAATSTTTTATPGSSRQVTGGDATSATEKAIYTNLCQNLRYPKHWISLSRGILMAESNTSPGK